MIMLKKTFWAKRISGDDYILHPLNVALILTEISADASCMAAALLHDTIEDSDATKEEIEKLFGTEVALLVDGVTKINKLNFSSDSRASAANQRKDSCQFIRRSSCYYHQTSRSSS